MPSLRRLLQLTLYAVVLLAGVEGVCRLYWKIGHQVPLGRPSALVYAFYPELEMVAERPIRRGDGDVDILLLGGSVVNDHYGNIAHLLEETLTRRLRRRVFVHNLGRTAHTSLDSLFKYQRLAGQRFDLVLVYHGINEARANNTPPDVYRDDYSHYAWYRTIHSLDEHTELPWYFTPFTFAYAGRSFLESWGLETTLSTGRPREDWLRYGSTIKTRESFRRNLTALVALMAERGDPGILMSFAYYVAPGYSEEAFRRFQLDYSLHAFPIELWGRPPGVAAAIDAHNAVVASVAASSPNVAYVDQNALIPKNADCFNDVCHLTGRGCQQFVDNLVEPILAALRE